MLIVIIKTLLISLLLFTVVPTTILVLHLWVLFCVHLDVNAVLTVFIVLVPALSVGAMVGDITGKTIAKISTIDSKGN
jgi:hypothetical protein